MPLFLSQRVGILKEENPTWKDSKCYYAALKDAFHLGLDVLAFWPVGGQVFDLLNGAIYTIEGNSSAARLNLLSAMMPVAGGWFVKGFKTAKLTLQVGAKRTSLGWNLLSNGVVHFGNRGQMRTVLGLTDTRQAHHLIPWEFINNSVVQKAAKSSHSFHMNLPLNGILLDRAIHVEGLAHSTYNARVLTELNAIEALNLNPDDTYNALNALISRIRTAITNNPGVPLNNIIF